MTQAMRAHECRMETEFKGAVRIVHVSGRLDGVAARTFRDRMRDDWTDGLLIIDLSRVAGMDAAGTGVVLAATGRARQRGQELVIVTVDAVLIEVLSALGPSVPVAHSQAQAWRLLCRPRGQQARP
jgi:anti-anti-sigma factor